MSLFKLLFQDKKAKREAEAKLEIGSRWVLKGKNGDPFESKKCSVYSTILDVKDGWVRYKMGRGNFFKDNRMEISSFLYIYKRA